jgi:hypothetical protein
MEQFENMHKHCECDHELTYCPKCDVVMCKKCGREWGKKTVEYVYTYNYPWYHNYPQHYYTYPSIQWGQQRGYTTTATSGNLNLYGGQVSNQIDNSTK